MKKGHRRRLDAPLAQPARQEARLDKGTQALVGKGPADYHPDDWLSLREQLRLTVLYPGRFVAFRDHFRNEGDSRRLVQREVLRSSRSLAAVSNYVDRLSEKERASVFIDYVEPTKQSRVR